MSLASRIAVEKAKQRLKEETMSQHTPGPWYEAKTGNHQGLVVEEGTGRNVAVAYEKADARLIAAAPALLAACRAVLKTLQEMDIAYETGDDELSDVTMLKDAIAHAEGRS